MSKEAAARALFATAAKGTEGALRDELRELRFRGVRADRGGVRFAGDLGEGMRACIELRTAIRVLAELATFDAPSGEALYEGVAAVDWGPFLSPSHTLAVRAACRSSALTHTQFIAQKTKDAIVDQLRRRLGARPSVDRDDPDVGIFVHLVRDRATVYADLSGAPLHRRGYRVRAGEAPLKETLAAAILRLSGWDRVRPLIDPMCGSGTIALEAALWSRDVAPGTLAGRRFGFERWASHDRAAARFAADLREAARARIRADGPAIIASDADTGAVEIAGANALAAAAAAGGGRDPSRAAVARAIDVRQRALRDLSPGPAPGHVVTNPPYGERLAGSDALYREMAASLGRLRDHRVTILAGAPGIERAMQRSGAGRPHVISVWNGPIPCRLLTYAVSGTGRGRGRPAPP